MSTNDRDQEEWGVVEEALPNVQFRVRLKRNNELMLSYLGGKLKKNFIKVIIGDEVKVFCPPQSSICRIVFRPSPERR